MTRTKNILTSLLENVIYVFATLICALFIYTFFFWLPSEEDLSYVKLFVEITKYVLFGLYFLFALELFFVIRAKLQGKNISVLTAFIFPLLVLFIISLGCVYNIYIRG